MWRLWGGVVTDVFGPTTNLKEQVVGSFHADGAGDEWFVYAGRQLTKTTEMYAILAVRRYCNCHLGKGVEHTVRRRTQQIRGKR
jgi:hypothetical protein